MKDNLPSIHHSSFRIHHLILMRAIPTLKISISGVRGVVGESLTPTLLTRFAQAFGTYVGPGAIVIGRDTRTSGEMVRQAVVAGLLSSGCRVIDLDVCPVPTVQLLVRGRGARGGLAITASHNPAEWNALKFINSSGLFLTAAQARQLLDIYHQGEYLKVPGSEMRSVEAAPGAIDLHVKAVLDALGPLPASARRLRVAVDSCNGAGSIVAPRLLEALGAEVFPVNTTPDGLFPRGAEPVPENLGALREAVREHGADVGFAQDMDADRLAVVDEGGEGNGGVIYPRINFARDSLVGMALVLHLLAAEGRTVSEILGELPRSFMVKEKLACRSDRIGRVLKRVRDEYARWPQDLRDGVKVTLPQGWLLVRGSNTEPIIRLVAEAETEEQARHIVEDLRAS